MVRLDTPVALFLLFFKRDEKKKKFCKKVKKILDKKGFMPFIIIVTWLVAVTAKIKGKRFTIFSSLIFERERSLSFTLAESLSQV